MDKAHTKHVEVALKISGDWKAQSKLLKEKFSQLTDADLDYVVGKENDLLTRMQIRLKKKREEVVNIIMKGQMAKA